MPLVVPFLPFLCTYAHAQDYTADEVEALTMIREADLGVERVYHDDEHYSFTIPEGVGD